MSAADWARYGQDGELWAESREGGRVRGAGGLLRKKARQVWGWRVRGWDGRGGVGGQSEVVGQ